jgi:PPOX class probable F420-dependent enzyme
MTDLHPRVREILAGDTLAFMSTIETDGRPQVTGIWVRLDGDEIVSAHLGRHRKLQNIERDPRVAYAFDPGTQGEGGLDEYLVIYGRARITEGGAPELLQELAHVYMGPDVVFPSMPDPPPGWIVRTTIERITGSGPWA